VSIVVIRCRVSHECWALHRCLGSAHRAKRFPAAALLSRDCNDPLNVRRLQFVASYASTCFRSCRVPTRRSGSWLITAPFSCFGYCCTSVSWSGITAWGTHRGVCMFPIIVRGLSCRARARYSGRCLEVVIILSYLILVFPFMVAWNVVGSIWLARSNKCVRYSFCCSFRAPINGVVGDGGSWRNGRSTGASCYGSASCICTSCSVFWC
jgi:hypothetical protein